MTHARVAASLITRQKKSSHRNLKQSINMLKKTLPMPRAVTVAMFTALALPPLSPHRNLERARRANHRGQRFTSAGTCRTRKQQAALSQTQVDNFNTNPSKDSP
jgi:hypothetical protein